MNLKKCENCKVGRWYYEMFGVVICEEDCPYKSCDTAENLNNSTKD